MTTKRTNFIGATLLGLAALAVTIPAAQARQYFLVIHSANATGFSTKGECERHSTSTYGCRLGLAGKYCNGADIYVNNRVADQMVQNYRAKRKIIVRYKNSNGSFGSRICSFN